jgi:hypothetical protein
MSYHTSAKRRGFNTIKEFEFEVQTVQPNLANISFKLPKHVVSYCSSTIAATVTLEVSHLSFEFFLKMICYPQYLLASPKNIGVHNNSTPEYASTANISTTPPSQ